MVTVIISDGTEGDDNTSSLGKGCCRGRPHVLKQTLLRLSEPQFLIVLGKAVHILWGSAGNSHRRKNIYIYKKPRAYSPFKQKGGKTSKSSTRKTGESSFPA